MSELLLTSFLEVVVHEDGADDEDVAGAGHGGDHRKDEQFDDAVPRHVDAVAGVTGVNLRQILDDGAVHFLCKGMRIVRFINTY